MDWHALLLMALPGGTKALRTDEELDELPPAAAGLRLDSATLLAGNLLSAARIVQARRPRARRARPAPRPRPGCPRRSTEHPARSSRGGRQPAPAPCRWAQVPRGASGAGAPSGRGRAGGHHQAAGGAPGRCGARAGGAGRHRRGGVGGRPVPAAPHVRRRRRAAGDRCGGRCGGRTLSHVSFDRLRGCSSPPCACVLRCGRSRARERGARAAQGCWLARRSRARCGRRRAGASSPPAACLRTPAAGCRRG